MSEKARLIGLSGEYSGRTFPLGTGEVLIGRAEDCRLQIVDSRISRQHAILRMEGGSWTIEDLESTHGTYVKGERIDKAVLQDGDTITIGETILRFEQSISQDAIPTELATLDEIETVLDTPDAVPTQVASSDDFPSQQQQEEKPATQKVKAADSPPGEKCSRCGAAFEETEKFCGECGEPREVQKTEKVPDALPTRKADGSQRIPPKVSPPEITPPTPPSKKKSIPWKWVAMGGSLIIALIIIGVGISLLRGVFVDDSPSTIEPDVDLILETPQVEGESDLSSTPLIPPTLTPTSELEGTPEAAQDTPSVEETTPGDEGQESVVASEVYGGAVHIAFASDRSGRPQIYLIDLATLEENQLTDVSGGACQPTWSPDGSRMAYTSPCNTNREEYSGSSIFILEVEETGNPGAVSQLVPTVGGGDYDPAWSRDGNRIAFTSWRTGRPQIFTVNPDGSDLRNLNDDLAFNWASTWAGDGSQLAFLTGRGGQEEIWTIPASGGEERRFSRSDGKDVARPDWSPDGSTIVFEKIVGNIPRLIAAPVADGGVRELQVCQEGQLSLQPMGEPTWSPDGSWLAFETWPDGVNHDIAVMRASCNDYAELTRDPGLDFDAAWRPMR